MRLTLAGQGVEAHKTLSCACWCQGLALLLLLESSLQAVSACPVCFQAVPLRTKRQEMSLFREVRQIFFSEDQVILPLMHGGTHPRIWCVIPAPAAITAGKMSLKTTKVLKTPDPGNLCSWGVCTQNLLSLCARAGISLCWLLFSCCCGALGVPAVLGDVPLSLSLSVAPVPARGSLWGPCPAPLCPGPALQPRSCWDGVTMALGEAQGTFGGGCCRAPCPGSWHCWWPGLDPGMLSAAMACFCRSLSPDFSTREWNVLRELC